MEEDYKSWEDLIDEEEETISSDANKEISGDDLAYLKSQVEIPEEINRRFGFTDEIKARQN